MKDMQFFRAMTYFKDYCSLGGRNEFITDNSRIETWKTEDSSPLKKLRAKQLLELSKQKPLTGRVDELAKLVLWEVSIIDKKEYEFTFMDGSKVKATV